MPIRVPFTECLESGLLADSSSPRVDFANIVKLVSKQMSAAKKHERFTFADLARARNVRGLEMLRPQIAITLSPKLARSECELFPVEGPYDLFFCFLEGINTVELGVCIQLFIRGALLTYILLRSSMIRRCSRRPL
jgi:hypothetical protein